MTERERYMLCSGCGYAYKESHIFKKTYKQTAICLCRKCLRNLIEEAEMELKNESV